MPLYEFTCETCGTEDEVTAPIVGEFAVPVCPKCDLPMVRVFAGALHLWDGGYPSKQTDGG